MAAVIKVGGLTGYTVTPPAIPAQVQVVSVLALGGVAEGPPPPPPPPPTPATVRIVEVLAVSEGIAPPPPPPPIPNPAVKVFGVIASTQITGAAKLVADAGADLTGIEPFATVTLTGVGSGSTGSALVYTWAQVAGPTITLIPSGAKCSFLAPASSNGTSVTISLTVSDGIGSTPGTDAVAVAVLPATEFIASGGTWLPLQILSTW